MIEYNWPPAPVNDHIDSASYDMIVKCEACDFQIGPHQVTYDAVASPMQLQKVHEQ